MKTPNALRALALLGLAAAGCTATATGTATVTPSASPTTAAATSAAPTASAAPASTMPGGLGSRLAGESKPFLGSAVSTYSVPGSGLPILEVGFELPLAAVEAAPTSGDKHETVRLGFPEGVKTWTGIDHLDLDFNAGGHPPPGVYNVPHFDMHFYTITAAEQDAIDCADKTMPAADRVPQGFMVIPPDAPMCEAKMGFHAPDLSAPELQPSPAPFTRTMVLGYYGGKMNFIEPMATRAFLLEKKDFTLAIGKPAKLGRKAWYPSTCTGKFDATKNAWSISLSGFAEIAE